MTAGAPPPRRSPVATLRAWVARHRPEILLVTLAIVIPEILTGSTPVFNLINPIDLAGLLGFYGAGSLLIRDVAIRWRKGWSAVLLLGLAYGIAEEGIATKTMVDPHSGAVGFLGMYGHFAGVNWVFAVVIAIFHAIFSIALPILLVELAYPEIRGHRLLSDRGELWALATFGTAVTWGYFGFDPHYFEGYAVLAGFFVAIGALCLAARWVPARSLEPASERPLASPRWFAGLGASFAFGWSFLYLIGPHVIPWPIGVIAGECAAAGGVLWLGLRRAGRLGHGRHAVYFGAGLLSWYLVWDVFVTVALLDYLVPVVLGLVFYGLIRLSRHYPAERPIPPLASPPPPMVGSI